MEGLGSSLLPSLQTDYHMSDYDNEIFPSEVRATCHGVSAASGKLGAAFGAYFFPLLLGPGGAAHPTNEGLENCMLICSFVAFLGKSYTMVQTIEGHH
eukprot:gene57996-77393_t